VGYLIVFVLLPLAYILIRLDDKKPAPGFRLPDFMTPVAGLIFVFNFCLLVIGGTQWGGKVIAIGLLLVLSFLPFYLLRRRRFSRS
jgi:hypothetical protein